MTALMTPEQRKAIAHQLGDARPATDELLGSLAESVVDVRTHDHPEWEDLFCMNLSSYMGERMAPVLRRLLDTEAELIKFRDQRNAVCADNEELLARIERSGLVRLRAENETRTIARERDGLRARVAELEAAVDSRTPATGDHVRLPNGEIHRVARTWASGRDLRVELDNGISRFAAAVTIVPAPVEDPHDSPLHHDYAHGRDLPEVTP
ncbi:hypothetical protein [Streptomyces sp. NPDC056323]|uniref:hypothetical protein n=1 Tax=Streptomyces sp. NPDC056323 TaxID=3345784 RepID=UPI0035E0140D